jgi:acetyl esterase/lipase
LGLGACNPASLLNATVPTGSIEIQRDLSYGLDPRNKADLYLPKRPQPDAPLLIFLYGGRWQQGSKADYLFVGQAFADAGIPTLIPDYRLWPQANWRDMLGDAATAVTWAAPQAHTFGSDPKRVFLMGHSAGAYLAAMLAVDPRWLGRPSPLRGWIGIAGPYDFLPSNEPDVAQIFADGATTQPVEVAAAGTPPTLLLQGGADDTVFPRNSERLAARLRQLGTRVETATYPGVGHIGIVSALSTTLRHGAPTFGDCVDFLRR